MSEQKIAVGTRFFEGKAENKDAALARIDKWVEGALNVTSPELVIVAVNVDADKAKSLVHLQIKYPQITTIPVTPWGKFVAPLNAIVYAGAKLGAEQFLFTSAEFAPERGMYEKLADKLDERKLAVGFRLDGHDFQTSSARNRFVVEANGAQIPWNTYVLWNKQLVSTGFILIGDSPYDEKNAGVEELATMALHHHLWPNRAEVVMLAEPSMSNQWDQAGWDQDRKEKHATKIASKSSRPATHLKALGLPGPDVLHLDLSRT